MREKIYVLGLAKAIGRMYPSFKEERRDSKLSFTKAISLAIRVHNHEKHMSEYGDGWVIKRESMKKAGIDPRTFNSMIKKYPLFTLESEYWNHFLGVAKRWQPTEDLMLVMDYYNQELSPDIFLLEMGKNPRMQIVDRVGSCLTADDYDYFCIAHIDTEGLISYFKGVLRTETLDISERVGMQMMMAIAKKSNGMLEQGYLRCKSGRLVSRGIGSVQNMRKEARKRAFKGCWDVDFVNCHYVLLNHLYENAFIEAYVENAYTFRNRIAEDVNIPISSVKKMLLAILYGCSLSFSGKGAIVQELGKSKGKDFLNHYNVKGIIEGVSDATEYLEHEGFLTELMVENNIPAKKALAYLLQLIESDILDYCIALYTPEALYYDGFVTQEDVDTDDLSAKILEDLSYDIKITKEKL